MRWPPTRSPARARARERGAYAAAALGRTRRAPDRRRRRSGRRLFEAAWNAWIAGSGEHAVSCSTRLRRSSPTTRRGRNRASAGARVARARRCDVPPATSSPPQPGARPTIRERRAPVGRGRLRGVLRRAGGADARGCPRRARGAPARRRRGRGLHGAARTRHGARLLGRRRRRSSRAAGGVRMAGTATADGPPLSWRWAVEAPLFLREVRTARESFSTHSRPRAIAESPARFLAALPDRARRGDNRSLARGPRELLRSPGARARHRTTWRGVRRPLRPGMAGGARGA